MKIKLDKCLQTLFQNLPSSFGVNKSNHIKAIYQQRWLIKGAADFGINKNLLNVNFHRTMQQFGGNKTYEQARWYVYQDSNGRPDINYMLHKGKSLDQGVN